ncbi:glycerophosphoryl diester phosphodiesterase [Marmoricola sp. OAE513]|uniref:glycerophosphodiester phosphodiesterase n=1 Tax=Marmoricola sp. OAE513 TaxID=2817894 RepID=UPI001AEBA454
MLRRRLVAPSVLGLSLLLALTAVLVATPPASAAARVLLKSAPKSSVSRPIINETFTISGSLGRSVPRVAALQRLVGGKWKVVVRRSITSSGLYSFAVTQPNTKDVWRVASKAVRYKGTLRKRRESRALTVYRQGQTAAISTRGGANVGTSVTGKAVLRPARSGRPVVVQVNEGLGWQTVVSTKTSSAGNASFSYHVDAVGTVKFRAVAKASRGAAEHIGTVVPVYVMPLTRMKVAAHRGYSSHYPENTIDAYRGALNTDTDWLETDFQRTAPDTEADLANGACSAYSTGVGDVHWIALHDADFSRTTDVLKKFPPAKNPTKYLNGRPLVDRFTLCEIKRLDAGAWKGFPGQQVPTLEQTLDEVRLSSNTDARLLVEPKLGSTTEAVALVDAIGAYDELHKNDPGYRRFVPENPMNRDDRAVFNTFDLAVAEALHQQRPSTEVAIIANEESEVDPTLDPLSVGIFVKDSLITRARVNTIHAAGKMVIAWTVNKEARWYELASLGVDVVVTDNSKAARIALTGSD